MPKLTAKNNAGYQTPAAVAADPVIFTVIDNQLAVLLLQRLESPDNDLWMLPGGFVGTTESADACAARKLNEKTGLRSGYLEQLRTYSAPQRDPRGWIPSIAFLALVHAEALPASSKGRWHLISDLPKIAFDHQQIIADANERLTGKLWYSNIAMGLLPEEFTLGEARTVYQAITGYSYDPANFARDIKASGLVKATGKKKSGSRGRPGSTFRFCSQEPEWAPSRGRG